MKSPPLTRRHFLLAVATGGVAATAAVTTVPSHQSVPKGRAKGDPAAGYQLTDHIRRYYRTARV